MGVDVDVVIWRCRNQRCARGWRRRLHQSIGILWLLLAGCRVMEASNGGALLSGSKFPAGRVAMSSCGLPGSSTAVCLPDRGKYMCPDPCAAKPGPGGDSRFLFLVTGGSRLGSSGRRSLNAESRNFGLQSISKQGLKPRAPWSTEALEGRRGLWEELKFKVHMYPSKILPTSN